jgi:1,2-dihydroxy-3-keto-5-methylthiopentene dioxygenase
MAEVRIRETDRVLSDPEEIASFVGDHGLEYEVWDISKWRQTDREALEGETDEEQILEVFADEIEELGARGGYASADVVALSGETPNLDDLLAKFDREHHHTEDEVRFVVDGRGVFTIHAEDDTIFDVEVHPGDLLVVPEGTRHWFTLCDDRQIQCIRVFTSTDGWVAHYDREEAAPDAE